MFLVEDRGYGIRYFVFEGTVKECHEKAAELEADPENVNGDGVPFTYSTVLDMPDNS